MRIRVMGVYAASAPEPCHLVELLVSEVDGDFDVGGITQEVIGQPRSNWQVPYDEAFLNPDGVGLCNPENRDAQPADSEFRLAFFFHYLDFAAPLLTPAGPLMLPEATPRPERLGFLEYEPPC